MFQEDWVLLYHGSLQVVKIILLERETKCKHQHQHQRWFIGLIIILQIVLSSSCVSVTVHVISYLPYQPDTIKGNTHPFTGNYEIYTTTNTTGIEYLWTLPSNWSGYSNTNSI